jgi:hypothetical protein
MESHTVMASERKTGRLVAYVASVLFLSTMILQALAG